ncbi:MAG: hypothetical protein WCQ57_12130 [Verrucomicrobiota bacterium]
MKDFSIFFKKAVDESSSFDILTIPHDISVCAGKSSRRYNFADCSRGKTDSIGFGAGQNSESLPSSVI